MKHYQIVHTTASPDWDTVPTLEVGEHLWVPSAGIRMQAQICYSEQGFHVHLRAWEPNIRAVLDQPLSMVCQDSCMEFFFRPSAEDMRYFNIEMNPLGTSYVGFGLERDTRLRLILKNDDAQLEKKAEILPDGWALTYTIPLSLLQTLYPDYTLCPGKVLYANLYKCGDLTDHPHFLAWNPVETESPDYHRPEFFGEMVLG